jgi:quercetin dioxygenase-like cupin family protein
VLTILFDRSELAIAIQAWEATMRMREYSLAIALLACNATGAYAQNAESVIKLPNEVEFKSPVSPTNLQSAVLFGDPSKPGVYVIRIKYAAGAKVMPHWHPDEVRSATVLSGTYYFAVGEQWDESKMRPYPVGTFLSEPARTPHYAWAKDGEVIVQFMGLGPTGITMIPQK